MPPLPAQTSPSLNANKKSASNFDNSHHTYHSILRILCEAFQIDYEGGNHKCERQLIDEAHRLNRQGKIRFFDIFSGWLQLQTFNLPATK